MSKYTFYIILLFIFGCVEEDEINKNFIIGSWQAKPERVIYKRENGDTIYCGKPNLEVYNLDFQSNGQGNSYLRFNGEDIENILTWSLHNDASTLFLTTDHFYENTISYQTTEYEIVEKSETRIILVQEWNTQWYNYDVFQYEDAVEKYTLELTK